MVLWNSCLPPEVLGVFTGYFAQFGSVVPFLMLAPAFFAGKITLGTMIRGVFRGVFKDMHPY